MQPSPFRAEARDRDEIYESFETMYIRGIGLCKFDNGRFHRVTARRGEGGARTKTRIRCRVDPLNSDPAVAAKWDAIIGSCVLVRRALLYSSRGRCEIIPRDSRFINTLDAHRLPFTWTMFAPVNNFIAGTESFHRVNRPRCTKTSRNTASPPKWRNGARGVGGEKMKNKK